MAWKRGQSGNPAGRTPVAPAVPINPEPVFIPALKRRDPANELIKLADKATSEKFKKDIWTFLFLQKYRAANIVATASPALDVDAQTDEELLRTLETQTVPKRVKSKARPVPVEPVETPTELDTITE